MRDYIFISVLPYNLKGAVEALQYSVKCMLFMYDVYCSPETHIHMYKKPKTFRLLKLFFFSLWLKHTARANC